MNKLNFYSARSAKETFVRLSRPAFVRGFNTIFNTMMSFGGQVTLPLTAAFNACLRLNLRSRSVCAVLLTGVFALALAGCGGGGSGGGGGGGNGSDNRSNGDDNDDRAVSELKATVSGNTITVSWKNPDQENIIGFNINWVNTDDAADGDADEFNPPPADVSAGALGNTYKITALTYSATYRITVTVRYANGDSVVSAPVQGRISLDPRAVSGIETAVAGNNITVSWTNPDQENITGFNITWVNVRDASDSGTEEFNPPEANVTAGAANNTDTISGLAYDTIYEITITVLYADGNFANSVPVRARTDPNLRAVFNIKTAVTGNNITVGWTNPDQNNITGFNITWVNVRDASDGGTKEFKPPEANVTAGAADNTDTITDLTYSTTYKITIAVLYADGTSVDSAPVQDKTSLDPRAAFDIRTTVSRNSITVRWTNPTQRNIVKFNIAWVNVRDASDSGTEEFNPPLANLAAGASGNSYTIPDLIYGATYELTIAVLYADGTSVNSALVQTPIGVDPLDGDNDGVVNDDDNCPSDANADQVNLDQDDEGDVCDDDDDNDGVKDTADACSLGDIGWASNPTTDNDGDGCQDDSPEDLDDDNDGVKDTADDCPSGDTGWTSNPTTDHDRDGCQDDSPEDLDDDNDGTLDTTDVDDNNNGLIDIRYLDDLARLRDDLNGDGVDDGGIDYITAVGTAGCPSSGCMGYELARSLNFSDPASYANGMVNTAWTSGSGWQPIGSCTFNNACFRITDAGVLILNHIYAAVFNGRGYAIADLFISAANGANGVGLFGAFNGTLQNLHLRNVNVRGGKNDVGALVGHGRNGRYENLSVTGGSVRSSRPANRRRADGVGGLIGDAKDAEIRSAYVSGIDVAGVRSVGGLVGFGQQSNISYAGASDTDVSGTAKSVGGLVGNGDNSIIRYARASDGVVAGTGNIGGLVGYGQLADISYAGVSDIDVSATTPIVDGRYESASNAGGLAGNADFARIRYAYVLGGTVSGTTLNVGGLAGTGTSALIYDSYTAAGQVSLLSAPAPITREHLNPIVEDIDRKSNLTDIIPDGIGGMLGHASYGGPDAGSLICVDNVTYLAQVCALDPTGTSLACTPGAIHLEAEVCYINVTKKVTYDDSGATHAIDSYWDTNTTGLATSPGRDGRQGEGKTTAELQNPITFPGSIYADWGGIWCDPRTGAEIISATPLSAPWVRVWDLGDADQYPVLNCLPASPAQQRQRRQ